MSKFNSGDVTDVLDSFFIVYAIDEDDDEASVQELMQQRSDMSEAVNEWYVKAKAFDEIIHAINNSSQPRQSGRRYIDKFEFTKKAENIIEKYESGESDGT